MLLLLASAYVIVCMLVFSLASECYFSFPSFYFVWPKYDFNPVFLLRSLAGVLSFWGLLELIKIPF